MDIVLDNTAFEQELTDIDQDSFNARRKRKSTTKRRSTVRRVSTKKPKGRVAYSKTGKRLKGRYVRV